MAMIRVFSITILLIVLLFLHDSIQIENSGNIGSKLPQIFFGLGWNKIGIVTKSPKRYQSFMKELRTEKNGFTKIKEILIPLLSSMDEEITDKQEDDELKHVLKRLKKF